MITRAMRRKLQIHASAADLLYIRKGNLDQCKCGNCKNETREIDSPCCREVDGMLRLLRLKSWRARETSHGPAFMGNCPTISHK